MPRKYFEPKKLLDVDGVSCWICYKAGCGGESDKELGCWYTMDAEQAEPGNGTSHHFDVRELPKFSKNHKGEWERGYHAAVILAQLTTSPDAIPLGPDWVPE